MNIKNIIFVVMVLLGTVLTSCQENEYGTVDLSGYKPAPPVTYTYNHPCALYTSADYSRVKASIADGSAPAEVKAEFETLKNNIYTSSEYQNKSHVISLIVRGSCDKTENYINGNKDAAAAYQFGLLYQITGEEKYAQWGIKILNDWTAGCSGIYTQPSDCRLAAGIMGFQFALAGEQLRTYSGWSESEFTAFKNWMKEKFYALNSEFLIKHNGTSQNCGARHYWSNWDLVNLCSMLQIGILLEDDDIVNEAKNYFLSSGDGNGYILNLCLAEKNDPLGTGEKMFQNQESGRDQGHAMMSTAVAIQLCQAAWALYQSNPTVSSLDFYSANNNAILRMAEYVAMTNLRDGSDNTNSTGNWICSDANLAKSWTAVGPFCTKHSPMNVVEEAFANDSGRGKVRPGWETLYAHFANVAPTTMVSGSGIAYAKMMADKMRPECGPGDSRYGSNSGAFDQIGWGTLMMYK